jgi:AraC family transcriptional regulator of adaptative response / DNA-3-methyladenine glycosylase II
MRHRPPRAPGIVEASTSETSHSVPVSSMNSRASLGSVDLRMGTSRSRITPRSAAKSAPPLDWNLMLRYLAPRCTPGVENASGSSYSRTLRHGRARGWVSVSPNLEVEVSSSLSGHYDAVLTKLGRLFDVETDVRGINRALSADPLLAPLVKRHPGLRVAGAVDRFELALRAVLGQQVSVAAASTFSGRLAALLGEPLTGAPAGLTLLSVTAERAADARPSTIAGIGLTRARAATAVALARAVVDGLLADDSDPESQIAALKEVHGIGDWTASYIAMRALHWPDAFPHGDLGLRKAAGNLTARELLAVAERWRPYRAYAAMHLWASLHA